MARLGNSYLKCSSSSINYEVIREEDGSMTTTITARTIITIGSIH